jgi:hypothetical protein
MPAARSIATREMGCGEVSGGTRGEAAGRWGASHAWVEALVPSLGRIAFDPTNNLMGRRSPHSRSDWPRLRGRPAHARRVQGRGPQRTERCGDGESVGCSAARTIGSQHRHPIPSRVCASQLAHRTGAAIATVNLRSNRRHTPWCFDWTRPRP